MRTQHTLSIFLNILATVLLPACKGPQGDPGPKGTTGATGTQGTAGVNGNANTVYSDWKTPAWDGTVTGIGSANVYLGMASTATPLLTKDAMSTAAIYTYIKYNDLVQDPSNAQLVTVAERITSDRQAVHYFKIPGRTTNARTDYAYAIISYDAYGENYFAPTATIVTAPYDATKGTYVAISDLTSKTASFYKELVKTLPQFRQVIVYGNVKGGRLTPISWNDYGQVKATLNLLDK